MTTTLGTKHECYQCHTKFYDLGRSDQLCPKCGANQKEHKQPETPHAPRAHRARVIEVPEDDHIGQIDEDIPAPEEDVEHREETSLDEELEREERGDLDETEEY